MKVTVNMNAVAIALLKANVTKAARMTADRMLAKKIDAGEIPFGEGTLQNVLTDVDDSAAKKGLIEIVTRGPYAARLYWHPEYNFNKEFNANAQGEWWEDYITGAKKEQPKKWFTYFYKDLSGGVIH